MRNLSRSVNLVFFQDDAHGEFGTAHSETLESPSGDSFNAFWDGQGLFHDVFEHSHEFTDQNFRGKFAMNIGGEMAAMGSMWYYLNELGMDNRLTGNRFWPDETVTMETTFGMVQEAIQSGYCNFGETLESNVPRQKPVDNYGLEGIIDDYHEKVKGTRIDQYSHENKEFARTYKKSVTKSKIANLHRYGFRMAEKLVPQDDDGANVRTLEAFRAFWDDFCQKNKAEELCETYKGITFNLYLDGDLISWEAIFQSRYPTELNDVTIRQGQKCFYFGHDFVLTNED